MAEEYIPQGPDDFENDLLQELDENEETPTVDQTQQNNPIAPRRSHGFGDSGSEPSDDESDEVRKRRDNALETWLKSRYLNYNMPHLPDYTYGISVRDFLTIPCTYKPHGRDLAWLNSDQVNAALMVLADSSRRDRLILLSDAKAHELCLIGQGGNDRLWCQENGILVEALKSDANKSHRWIVVPCNNAMMSKENDGLNGIHWGLMIIDRLTKKARYIDGNLKVKKQRGTDEWVIQRSLGVGMAAGKILCGIDRVTESKLGEYDAETLMHVPHDHGLENSFQGDESSACGPYLYAILRFILEHDEAYLEDLSGSFSRAKRADNVARMKFDSKKTRARIQTGLERKWRKDDNSSPRFKVSREVGDILRLPNARETFNRWIRFKYPSIALDLSHDDFDDDPKPHRPSGKPNSTPKNNTSAGRKTPEPPKSVHSTPPPNATQTGSGPKDTQQGSGTNTAQQGEAPNTAQPGSGSTSAPTSNAPSPKPTGNKPPEGEDPDKSKPTKKPSKTDKKPVRKQPGGKGDKKNNPNDLSNVEKDYTDLSTVPDSEIEEWVKLTGPLSDTHEPGKDIWWDRFHLQKAFMGGWRHLERKKDENKESKESKKKEASRKRWKTGPAEVDTTLKKGGVDRVPGRLESMAKGKEVFDRRDHFELIPDHARKQVLMAQDDLKSRIGASATATAAGKAAKPAKEKRKHTAAEEGTEKPAKKPKGNATESEESSSQARPSVGEQTEDVAGSSADPATERGTKRDADDADVETARPEPSKRRKSD